ncbi:MAG TPA: hypothetical protein VMX55_03985 [candidate division Zixibacteria bacterium]|nr:hypothetical protein [candidate division Zixibacteria bacterium]
MSKLKKILILVISICSFIISISGLLMLILIESVLGFSLGIAFLLIGLIITIISFILIIDKRRRDKPSENNEIAYELLKNKINNQKFEEKINKTIYFNPDLSLKEKAIKLLEIGMKPIQIPLLFDLDKSQIMELEQIFDEEIGKEKISFDFELREETRNLMSNRKNHVKKKNHLKLVALVTQKGVNFLKSAFDFQLNVDEKKSDLMKAISYFEEALKIESRFLLAHLGMIQIYINLLQFNLANEWEAKAVMFNSVEYTNEAIKLTKMIMGRKKEIE